MRRSVLRKRAPPALTELTAAPVAAARQPRIPVEPGVHLHAADRKREADAAEEVALGLR
jgi:hypothetical protein